MLARHTASHAHGNTPDPIRIVAGSAALIINAAVALLLLQPRQWSELALPTRPERPTVVELIPRTVIPAPPTPAPPQPAPAVPTTRAPIAAPPQPTPVETAIPLPVAPVATQNIIDSAPSTPTAPSGTTQASLDYAFAPPPPYPVRALSRGIEGTVWLRIEVDEAGTPAKVTVERSSGDRMLDGAARSHVLNRWRFQPARLDGEAIRGVALVPVTFEIERR